jgi:hypothetical protein
VHLNREVLRLGAQANRLARKVRPSLEPVQQLILKEQSEPLISANLKPSENKPVHLPGKIIYTALLDLPSDLSGN